MSRVFFRLLLRLRTSLLGLIVLCATAKSYAVVIRDDVADSEYKDFASQFSSVGRIYSGREDGLLDVGSGTLIGTRWVLTAVPIDFSFHVSIAIQKNGILFSLKFQKHRLPGVRQRRTKSLNIDIDCSRSLQIHLSVLLPFRRGKRYQSRGSKST